MGNSNVTKKSFKILEEWNKYTKLIRKSTNPIGILNIDLQPFLVNKSFLNLYNCGSKKELIMYGVEKLLPNYQPHVKEETKLYLETESELLLQFGNHHYSLLQLNSNGMEMWTHVWITMIEFNENKLIQVIVNKIENPLKEDWLFGIKKTREEIIKIGSLEPINNLLYNLEFNSEIEHNLSDSESDIDFNTPPPIDNEIKEIFLDIKNLSKQVSEEIFLKEIIINIEQLMNEEIENKQKRLMKLIHRLQGERREHQIKYQKLELQLKRRKKGFNSEKSYIDSLKIENEEIRKRILKLETLTKLRLNIVKECIKLF